MKPTPRKILDDPAQKGGNKNGLVSSFVTKYCCQTIYYLNIEAIFLQLVRTVKPADLIFVTSTSLMGALLLV